MSCALALSVGCAGHLAQSAGERIGGIVAERVVRDLPTPHADTPTTIKGGDWCAVMEAKGWPKHPRQAVIDAMTDDELVTFVSISEHGEQFCAWKP